MRSPVSLLLACSLALVPACLGGGGSVQGPITLGDASRTSWQISDGLCAGGLFSNVCDLSQRAVVGATPRVQIRGYAGTSLGHATLMGGGGVTISGFTTSTSDQGTLLEGNVGRTTAGIADVIVLDASGHEIDRAHITFAVATVLVCGNAQMAAAHDLAFPGLSNGPVTIVQMPGDAGTSSTVTILACRANDAAGSALLSVDAIQWSVAIGATGTVSIASDDVFGTTPAHGARARLTTSGTGNATITATLGDVTQTIPVSFR